MGKLTKAQIQVLRELSTEERGNYADSYTPVQKLLAKGLINIRAGKWGGSVFMITEAGRAALKEQAR